MASSVCGALTMELSGKSEVAGTARRGSQPRLSREQTDPWRRAAGVEEVGWQLFPGSPKCWLVGAPYRGAFVRLPLCSVTSSFTVRFLSSSAQPCHGSNPPNASEPESHEDAPCGRRLPHAGACQCFACVWEVLHS